MAFDRSKIRDGLNSSSNSYKSYISMINSIAEFERLSNLNLHDGIKLLREKHHDEADAEIPRIFINIKIKDLVFEMPLFFNFGGENAQAAYQDVLNTYSRYRIIDMECNSTDPHDKNKILLYSMHVENVETEKAFDIIWAQIVSLRETADRIGKILDSINDLRNLYFGGSKNE